MADLNHGQFGDFFHSIHGHPAFEWQKRLAKEVLFNGWCDCVRVPTACGKTSILDIALFHLAKQSELAPAKRTAARRICFVVDRQVVIDEVTKHAIEIKNAIQKTLDGNANNTVLNEVCERLARMAADCKEPLRIVRLRGGVYRDDSWTIDPITPTVLISTVDQIGSRLLFRGYGTGDSSQHVQAGLLAFDTRIILDEAHLSGVFAETVQRVRAYQAWAEELPIPEDRRVSITRMSATGPLDERSFELSGPERKETTIRSRLEASKLARLVEVEVKSLAAGIKEKQPQRVAEVESRNRAEFARKALQHAKTLAGVDGPSGIDAKVIGVIVNRVATARMIFTGIRDSVMARGEGSAFLLTGRIRPHDRDALLTKWLPQVRVGRTVVRDKPLFVVATQTIEVGANLDFDAMVTEAAPIDCLRQRFGRMDRLGKRHEQGKASSASILMRTDQKGQTYKDAVYGSAVACTWQWLRSVAKKDRKHKSLSVDFGVNGLDTELARADAGTLNEMLAAQPQSPLLFPANLDAWIQTNPKPEPDPDIDPFLHGRAQATADVLVVWRKDLIHSRESKWKDIVSLMPPRVRETLPVPLYEVRRWLENTTPGEVADVEGGIIEAPRPQQHQTRPVLRWRGAQNPETRVVSTSQIRSGDTIVVPASYGGADEYGWNPESNNEVSDVADESLAEFISSYSGETFRRPKLRLRLYPQLLEGVFAQDSDNANVIRQKLQSSVSLLETEQDGWGAIRELLALLRKGTLSVSRRAAIDALLSSQSPPEVVLYPDKAGLVLAKSLTVSVFRSVSDLLDELDTEDEDDDSESMSSTGGNRVLLDEHTTSVQQATRKFAEECGLSESLRGALEIAAQWHDQGKRDYRFQSWLFGSQLKGLAAVADERPLAKSGRAPNAWKPSSVFGYPRGARHEFVSLRLFENAAFSGLIDTEVDLDLTKLLIGTHHGRGRSLVPPLNDTSPVEVEVSYEGHSLRVSSDHCLYRLDSGWVDLFWRVVLRYGHWGVAYLEALLITADRFVSAREQEPRALRKATT